MSWKQHFTTTADFPEGWYVSPKDGLMSIGAAVSRQHVSRGTEKGWVVLDGVRLTASAAIESGMIDRNAADYIASREGADAPAPFIREDHGYIEPTPLFPVDATEAIIEAFVEAARQRTPEAKKAAADALRAALAAQ